MEQIIIVCCVLSKEEDDSPHEISKSFVNSRVRPFSAVPWLDKKYRNYIG